MKRKLKVSVGIKATKQEVQVRLLRGRPLQVPRPISRIHEKVIYKRNKDTNIHTTHPGVVQLEFQGC